MSFAWVTITYLDEEDFNARVQARARQQATTNNQP
jgi:hypothetical protein